MEIFLRGFIKRYCDDLVEVLVWGYEKGWFLRGFDWCLIIG